jgi:rubrerythrin
MNMFDIAIGMEIEGASFYQQLAENAGHEGLTRIFTLLRDDEKRHKEFFEGMKAKAVVNVDASFVESSEVEELVESLNDENFSQLQNQKEAYENALNVELKSIQFYTEQRAKLTDDEEKKVLDIIIKEERRHYDLLDSIIIMVNRPNSWVEHAEFGVRDPY